jgi:endonuclease-3 related protein
MPSAKAGVRVPRPTLSAVYRCLYRRWGPQGWWPARSPLEVIVGVVLTQNTAWTNVVRAIANLKQARMLSLPALRRIDEKRLARLIVPAGYYNVKARRLKNVIRFIAGHPGGLAGLFRTRTHTLRERLLTVNGLGPESVDSILLYAAGKPVFVVDAYTRRIFSRHGFFPATADYHYVQEFFMSHLPCRVQLFNEFHALIVALGKHHCRAKPRCEGCPLAGF